jgi:molybdate transport system ATP-binding protein
VLATSFASRRGALELEVAFAAPARATTVLVGESGAGKTSTLRILAGLDLPKRGRLALDEEVWLDSETGRCIPAWERDIGYVSQDYALFPHLSVTDNIAFGLKAQGLGSATIRERVEGAMDQISIGTLGDRRPAQLSGGQQQRVALARALVLRPRLLLLDEPLSALDLKTRRQVRTELRGILQRLSCVTIYVTHSPLEALLFGDQIVVLHHGRVSQCGSRDELLRYPRSRYVAELMGTNLFEGTLVPAGRLEGSFLHTAEGGLSLEVANGSEGVFALVDPTDITLYREPPAGGASAQNLFAGPILEMVPEPPAGERVRVVLGTHPVLVAEVTREAVSALALRDGDQVFASFKATGVRVYR